MAETFIVKVNAAEFLKLLEKATNKENLGRCLHVFADLPADAEVAIQVDDPTSIA